MTPKLHESAGRVDDLIGSSVVTDFCTVVTDFSTPSPIPDLLH